MSGTGTDGFCAMPWEVLALLDDDDGGCWSRLAMMLYLQHLSRPTFTIGLGSRDWTRDILYMAI